MASITLMFILTAHKCIFDQLTFCAFCFASIIDQIVKGSTNFGQWSHGSSIGRCFYRPRCQCLRGVTWRLVDHPAAWPSSQWLKDAEILRLQGTRYWRACALALSYLRDFLSPPRCSNANRLRNSQARKIHGSHELMIDSWYIHGCESAWPPWSGGQKCHPHFWRVQRSTSCIPCMNHWYPLISVEGMPGTDAMARCWTSCCAAVPPPGRPPNVAGRCPGGTVATVPRKAARLNWLEDACMRNQSSSTPWDPWKTTSKRSYHVSNIEWITTYINACRSIITTLSPMREHHITTVYKLFILNNKPIIIIRNSL